MNARLPVLRGIIGSGKFAVHASAMRGPTEDGAKVVMPSNGPGRGKRRFAGFAEGMLKPRGLLMQVEENGDGTKGWRSRPRTDGAGGLSHGNSSAGFQKSRRVGNRRRSRADVRGLHPTLRYQFVHDDRGQILENPAIHTWHSVPTYFTAHVWAGVMPDEWVNYYRPLFLLWVRINEAVLGNRAWAWHLTTILTHVLTTVLVYLLAWRLGIGRDVALLAALIFGLHPAHIEAVAWISGVNEPLLGIFLIASLLAYIHSRTAGTARWKSTSLVLFACALLMKENALVLPGLLLVYEWVFGKDWGRPLGARRVLTWCAEAVGQIWPYFVLVALYVVARIYALKGFTHIATPLSAAQLVFTWPSLFAFWVRHLVWPAGLSTYYNFPAVLHPTLRNFVLPAIFDAAVGLGVFAVARRSRPGRSLRCGWCCP